MIIIIFRYFFIKLHTQKKCKKKKEFLQLLNLVEHGLKINFMLGKREHARNTKL